ncbi:MAG: amino acid--tRNA ligase-related protein, partial [Tenuifilaceae bacterium]|nr:amino acid--tRNA ligase-related protein [Tenuifilaceae bacterium]
DFARIIAAMPPVSGVAMGLDRLQMLLMGRQSLDEVLLFPLSRILGDTGG